MFRSFAVSVSLIRRVTIATTLAGVMACLAPSTFATDPLVSNIVPPGGQRGTEVDVVVSGSRLDDVEEIVFYDTGLKVLSLEPRSASSFNARLAISDDCRLGNHAARIRTATGITKNVALFSVGVLPEIQEKEPNNDFDTAQEVALGTTVNGVIALEDADYYFIEADKGQAINIEVEGVRLGRTAMDSYVIVFDAEQQEIARCDDEALTWQDAVVSFVAEKKGRYYIQVRDSLYSGSSLGNYRMHVGEFPRPMAVYPPGGQYGEKLQVQLIQPNAKQPSAKQQLTLPESAQLYSFVFLNDMNVAPYFATTDKGVAPTPNILRVNDLPNALEVEPNNDRDSATPATVPAGLTGIISEPGDVDLFKFEAKKDQTFELRVHARSLRSPLDSVLSIYDARGRRLANNDDMGNYLPDSYLRFKAPADGEYFVEVRDLLDKGGPHFVYRVEVSLPEPAAVFTAAEKARYIDTVLNVPRGSRGAFMLNVRRQNFSGDLELDFANLPPGVEVHTIPYAGNKSSVPVVIAASKDTEKTSGLIGITGRLPNEKEGLAGGFREVTMMVRGQNAREVWSHTSERFAMAVIDEAPFELELVQPKVPLVRRGSKHLKVVAKRAKDFTAPITVRLLYNPSGVSSSANVVIAGNETEAEIPLTATSGAELGTFKIVAVGVATVGNGPLEIASNLVELQVAEPYFDLTFKPSAVRQNEKGVLTAVLESTMEFDGEATIELVGLPANSTAEPITVKSSDTDAIFTIDAADNTPIGRHKSVMAKLTVVKDGEPILHMLGPGELRVDRPAATPAGGAKPAVASTKPLSRLEQLRQERAAEAAAQQNQQNQ